MCSYATYLCQVDCKHYYLACRHIHVACCATMLHVDIKYVEDRSTLPYHAFRCSRYNYYKGYTERRTD